MELFRQLQRRRRVAAPSRGRGPSLYCGIPNVSHTFTFCCETHVLLLPAPVDVAFPVLQPNRFCYSTTRGLSRKGVAPRGKPVQAQTFIRRLSNIVRSHLQDCWVHCYRFATRSALLRRVVFWLLVYVTFIWPSLSRIICLVRR